MNKKLWIAVAAVGGMLALPARAADHADGTPATLNQPDASSDITDLFVWMADATHANLVMDVFPNAMTGSKFSNAVKYVFHTTAHTSYTATTGNQTADVICTF